MPSALWSMTTPMLALVVWTFVMWAWMYATRLPALGRARREHGVDINKVQRARDLDMLPVEVTRVADNYNHLHEQPTVFYALCVYSHLSGVADDVNIALAWGYVGLRIVHSLWQVLVNRVPVRFLMFVACSLALMVITVRNVVALFAAG